MTKTPKKKSIKINIPTRNSIEWIINPAFGSYASRNAGFIEYLNEVRLQIESYITRDGNRRPLNILLAAPPGSGKSFLIKQLVQSISTPRSTVFEEVYVGSFNNFEELYGIFLRIQSINLQSKIPVVFFDEVDSKIGDFHIYQKLLAPMWDGEYYVGKDKYTLGKCILFFAGSTLSMEEESRKIVEAWNNLDGLMDYDRYYLAWEKSFLELIKRGSVIDKNKIHDFVDRIDTIIRIPPIVSAFLGENIKDEYCDVILMLIRKHFPSVKLVGKKLLNILYQQVGKGGSIRSIEKTIFGSPFQDGDTFDLKCLSPRNIRMMYGSKRLPANEKYYEVVVREPGETRSPTSRA